MHTKSTQINVGPTLLQGREVEHRAIEAEAQPSMTHDANG